jgi:hypothetical protein
MTDPLERAIDDVVTYLQAMERRDFVAARAFVADGRVAMTFPGDRRFNAVEQIAGNSAGRYRRVQKNITRKQAWNMADGRIGVLVSGTLYGEWTDGEPFEGIRFVDWFELEQGLIVRQDVWNDTAERMIQRAAEHK